ncbi:MAG: cyanoexosortase A, partial [Xenococcus sp. (in: cyanobacteria)]
MNYINFLLKNNLFWLFSSLAGLGVFHLNLIWKVTGNLDELTTNILFYGAIFGLLWQRKEEVNIQSDLFSSCLGLSLLTIIIIKTIYLFSFEYNLLSLIPLFAGISLALIASGFRGLGQYSRELFFAWFLFFPTGVIGNFIDNSIKITVLNAKFA